jgi:hypothetical protein
LCDGIGIRNGKPGIGLYGMSNNLS